MEQIIRYLLQNLQWHPNAHRGRKNHLTFFKNYSAVSFGFQFGLSSVREALSLPMHYGTPEPSSSLAHGKGAGNPCRVKTGMCLGSEHHY